MKYDIVIIGAGIVGLATALKTLEKNAGAKVLILEKESEPALHQTGNNSGVIHSGLYYKPGSMKALNCIRGYNMLVEFCQKHQIPFELCGKIVVATNKEEIPYLNTLYDRGIENGLTNLEHLKAEKLKEYEPHVNGVAGLHVPQTGIVDYKQVAQKYADLVQEKGGEIKYSEKVLSSES